MESAIIFIVLMYLTLCFCRHLPTKNKSDHKDYPSFDRRERDDGMINDINGKMFMPPKLPKLSAVAENDDLMWLSTPYEVNHYANTGTLGVGVGNHGGVLYPHVHPDVLAASHPFAPVMRLPAVYTRRREHTPFFNAPLHELTRAARLARADLDDELLDELSKDAMMPNILPTMSIPMGRSYANENMYGSLSAVFPGHPSSCSIPILLSCSPNIAKGILGASIPETKKEYRSTKVKFNDKNNEGRFVATMLPETLPKDGVQ